MFTTLVLSAGNLHGLMYIGAYKCLLEQNKISSLKNVVGCSAGACIGLMMVLGLSIAEMVDVSNDIFVNIGIPTFTLKSLMKMWKTMGVTNGDFKIDYFRRILKKKIDQNDITFIDLAKRTGKNLIVVGSNVTKMCSEEFSLEKTPNMSVMEAINISTSIPFLFSPVKWHHNLYVDGGLFNYVPISFSRDSEQCTLTLICDWTTPLAPETLWDMFKALTNMSQIRLVNEQCKSCRNLCRLVSTEEANAFQIKFFGTERLKLDALVITNLVTEGYTQMSKFINSDHTDQSHCS